MNTIGKIAAGAAALYISSLTGVYSFQRHLQYFPTNLNPDPVTLGLEDVSVEAIGTSDGETLVAWYSEPASDRPTILYFQGNAGEIAHRADRFDFLQRKGYGLLFLSPRGYGGSTGEITEAGLITDATAAYDWLVDRNTDPDSIVLLGESLGTGLAVQLAAKRRVAAVMLEAPYSSTVDVAANLYPFFPVRMLMKDQMRSIDHIASIDAPLLIQHGTGDRIVPFKFGQRLFDAAKEPKELVSLPGQGHEAILTRPVWLKEISFLDRVFENKS